VAMARGPTLGRASRDSGQAQVADPTGLYCGRVGEERSRIGDESPVDWRPRSPARLELGSRLGPYRIDALVGSGGMGDVYRGVDTRLDRPVAIKVSADQFGGRFDREAHAIAALNHPNICTLYDVGPDYLVMELVEGETLATRLREGALPTELILQYGLEIARALRSAHDKGIVHRDLKPGNVMVTKSGVKVLDFGLAKQLRDETQTATNAIVGTPAYMAPEQLAGQEADTRADIYAFGLVLYEMATGKRLGRGEFPTESDLTPALAQIVRSCLANDLDKRWQSAADLEIALGWPAAQAPPASRARGWWPWVMAAVFALTTAAVIFYPRERLRENSPVQLQLNPPPGTEFRAADIALSPDGKQLAFVTGGSVSTLWVRALDSLTARELKGTDAAALPFWSPDQRALGFFAGGKVKRIDLANERVVTLADAPAGRGGSWNADNVILFSAATNGPIWKVPAGGGTPAVATTLDTEASHRFPSFLPDGRHFLFYVRAADPDVRGIYWTSLDDSRVKQRVVETMFSGIYAPPGAGQSGRLFWMTEEGGLVAQTFDAASGRVSGDPALVPGMGLLSQSGYDRHTALSISNDGTMVYGTNDARYQLAWYDRQGRPSGTIGQPDAYLGDSEGVRRYGLRISPDGTRAAVAVARAGDQSNLWAIDLASGNFTRVTADGAGGGGIAWSPNGLQIAYLTGGAFTDMRSTVFVADTSGAAPRIRLTNTPHSQSTPDWSADGKFVLFQQTSREANFDLWYVSLTGDRKAVPFLQTTHQESRGRFSPEGKWVAYTSNQSGRQEIWLAAFPSATTNQQVSFGGGADAVWRRDGKELYYRSADGNLMTIPVEDVAGKLRFGTATTLFPMTATVYDVAPQGDRFLMLTRVRAAEVSPLVVLLNWQQKLTPQ